MTWPPSPTPPFYVTTFCNFPHDLRDGVPWNHECYVIPPRLLELEKDYPDDPHTRTAWSTWSEGRRRRHKGRSTP